MPSVSKAGNFTIVSLNGIPVPKARGTTAFPEALKQKLVSHSTNVYVASLTYTDK